MAEAPCFLRWLHLNTFAEMSPISSIFLLWTSVCRLLRPCPNWFSFVQTFIKWSFLKRPWETLGTSRDSVRGSCGWLSIHICISNKSIVSGQCLWSFDSRIHWLIVKELRLVEWNWLSQVNGILMSILLALVSVFLLMSTSTKESSCSNLLPILSGLCPIRGVGVCSNISIVLVLVLLLNWWIKWDWSVCDHTACRRDLLWCCLRSVHGPLGSIELGLLRVLVLIGLLMRSI